VYFVGVLQTGQDVGFGGGLVGVTRGIFGADVAGALLL